MNDMDDLIRDFLVESYENLDQLDRDFVALETEPGSAPARMASIFRTIHTIKGTCGCLGLSKLEAVAHVGENLLSRLRDGQLVMDTAMTTALLKLVDAVREILNTIETTGQEGNGDYTAICAELARLNERPSIGAASAPAAAPVAPTPVAALVPQVAEPEPATEPIASEPHEPAHAPTGSEADHAPSGEKHESVSNNAVRVDVVQLDKLMNLVGELVLTRNQVLQFISSTKDVGLLRTAQRLNLITSELQEGVMKTRMQPIGNLWNKFPRIVRDVATTCGKKVRLEMDGKETELDRTIIEAIKDPLTHVIRNSVDHGVETPEKRRARNKPEEGRLFMRAFHEGGQVIIEITDDGAGIDPERVKRKAVEKGILTAEQAARTGEREAIALVFAPGFSTAEKITNVSGRGVGMDVVKTNVEKIGGTVDISSRLNEGTTLRIKIPLTLAIIPALIITSGGDRFCIPQVSLLELIRVDAKTIERINGQPLYRLRGQLLPLANLNTELALLDTPPLPNSEDPVNIVVLRGGDRQFGLIVDAINDTEEIVVKPLAKQLKGINVFAGATIMGDGKVALILDVMGVAQRSNVIGRTNDTAAHNQADAAQEDTRNRQQLLLCRGGAGQRMAIPLSLVARLEEFSRAAVEDAGGQPVVQYRGQIMPLINVCEKLGDARATARTRRVRKDKVETSTLQTVVYSHGERNIGLLVEQIVDVVEERVDLQTNVARSGVLGTAIIKEKVTELLDVAEIVRTALGAAA